MIASIFTGSPRPTRAALPLRNALRMIGGGGMSHVGRAGAATKRAVNHLLNTLAPDRIFSAAIGASSRGHQPPSPDGCVSFHHVRPRRPPTLVSERLISWREQVRRCNGGRLKQRRQKLGPCSGPGEQAAQFPRGRKHLAVIESYPGDNIAPLGCRVVLENGRRGVPAYVSSDVGGTSEASRCREIALRSHQDLFG